MTRPRGGTRSSGKRFHQPPEIRAGGTAESRQTPMVRRPCSRARFDRCPVLRPRDPVRRDTRLGGCSLPMPQPAPRSHPKARRMPVGRSVSATRGSRGHHLASRGLACLRLAALATSCRPARVDSSPGPRGAPTALRFFDPETAETNPRECRYPRWNASQYRTHAVGRRCRARVTPWGCSLPIDKAYRFHIPVTEKRSQADSVGLPSGTHSFEPQTGPPFR